MFDERTPPVARWAAWTVRSFDFLSEHPWKTASLAAGIALAIAFAANYAFG